MTGFFSTCSIIFSTGMARLDAAFLLNILCVITSLWIKRGYVNSIVVNLLLQVLVLSASTLALNISFSRNS
jgi:hypothetical protein